MKYIVAINDPNKQSKASVSFVFRSKRMPNTAAFLFKELPLTLRLHVSQTEVTQRKIPVCIFNFGFLVQFPGDVTASTTSLSAVYP